MYYVPDYSYTSNTTNMNSVWIIVSLILALIGGLVVYFLFVKDGNKVQNKYLAWIKEYFNFNKMLIEDLLKIIYIILAIFITLFSIELISESFISFILFLVIGNVLLRLAFEACLVNILIWKNTNEINKKLKK